MIVLSLHKLSLSGAKETHREKYGELWILCKNCLLFNIPLQKVIQTFKNMRYLF